MKVNVSTLRKIIREEIKRKIILKRIIEGNEPDEKEPPKDKPLILVNSGSFNPIHRGHIEVTIKSKQAAEKLGYEVKYLYILPRGMGWLGQKFSSAPDKIIPDKQRVEFIKEAIATDGQGITLDTWEVSQGGPKTPVEMKDYFEGKHNDATFVIVVGSDYGHCEPTPCIEFEKGTWQLRMPRADERSSTMIRNLAAQGGDMSSITYPGVEKYMKSKYGGLRLL